MVVSPYGFWSSPITSDLVVADAIRLDQVALDVNAIYWTESQPQKQGRYFLYRVFEGEEPELVTPDDENHFNVRTRVREPWHIGVCTYIYVTDCAKSQSTSKVPMIVAARQCRPMTHVQTLTMRLPRFSPARSPIKAAGVFSSPSITSSSTFNLPASTQSRRSAIARSRWLK